MIRLSKLIITKMQINGKSCTVCAHIHDQKVVEIHLKPVGVTTALNNIYVGQVEKIAANIQAAFVRLGQDFNGYLPLNQAEQVIYTDGRKKESALRPGDEILVQISREAMKGKLPALTSNLNFSGKYLVLTSGNQKIGFSNKLSKEECRILNNWLEEERNDENRTYGIIVRTNSAEASKEEFFRELDMLKKQYEKTVVFGRSRTCFSLLYESEPFYLTAVRNTYTKELEEIVTDIPEFYDRIKESLEQQDSDEIQLLHLYQDKLLPLYKLYNLEGAFDEICHEKVWLKSGGFLVIQQTEAFVSIDVNSGKYTGKKKAEETYRKINLEAAEEIARQIRLRNLSGIILVDFINMKNPDHQDELFHVLQKYLRRDPVKTRAVDITPLHILEMTRQKVNRPVIEDIRMICE
ncbi:ribonuclease E/G [Blautia sp. HCP28S3_G10]|uniref:ribonuclease E/G n=1 Tax=Blautia sp. HCP28S3_G10 TaxID=3438908 RepID=UPI003F8AEDD3